MGLYCRRALGGGGVDSGGAFGQGEVYGPWVLREVVLLTKGNGMDDDMKGTACLCPFLISKY